MKFLFSYFIYFSSHSCAMNGINCNSLCNLLCCPPFPSRIAAKLAFLPPEASYSLIKENGKHALAFPTGPYMHDFLPTFSMEKVEVFTAATRKGNTIVMLYMKTNPGTKLTFLLSHGNAVDIGLMLNFMHDLSCKLGVNVMCYDYSGYGASTGKTLEKHLYADADCAIEHLQKRFSVPLEQVVLYGQSIGTVPTVYLATRYRVAAVVLHSPLMSGLRVAFPKVKRHYCCDVFPNLQRTPRVISPTLIIHGTCDDVIGIHHGHSLYAALPETVVLEPLFVNGGGHNDCEMYPQYLARLLDLVHNELPHLIQRALTDRLDQSKPSSAIVGVRHTGDSSKTSKLKERMLANGCMPPVPQMPDVVGDDPENRTEDVVSTSSDSSSKFSPVLLSSLLTPVIVTAHNYSPITVDGLVTTSKCTSKYNNASNAAVDESYDSVHADTTECTFSRISENISETIVDAIATSQLPSDLPSIPKLIAKDSCLPPKSNLVSMSACGGVQLEQTSITEILDSVAVSKPVVQSEKVDSMLADSLKVSSLITDRPSSEKASRKRINCQSALAGKQTANIDEKGIILPLPPPPPPPPTSCQPVELSCGKANSSADHSVLTSVHDTTAVETSSGEACEHYKDTQHLLTEEAIAYSSDAVDNRSVDERVSDIQEDAVDVEVAQMKETGAGDLPTAELADVHLRSSSEHLSSSQPLMLVH